LLRPDASHHRSPRRTTLAAALVALALAAGGCGGSDSSSPQGAPTSPGASATEGGSPPMATQVSLGKVSGTVRKPFRKAFKKHRDALETAVRTAVDGWIDGGFVGVGYPADGFPQAFDTFTSQAAADAQRQKALMTNWKWRKDIDGVTPTQRKVTLDVLAPKGRAAGVTARVRLKFTTTGEKKKKVTVTGRLFLARNPQGSWQIFGYDVSKGVK
jgi:hypothetical protein